MTRATCKKAAALTVALAALIGLGVGCNGKQTSPPAGASTAARALPPASRPLHSVQVQQLKPLMHVLLKTTTSHRPQTLPTDVEQPVDPVAQQKAYDEAAILADQLTIAVSQIPATVGEKKLPSDLRVGFLAEVQALKDQVAQLKSNASQKRAESMSRNLDAINATCINCHSKYRDLTGNLEPLRAAADDAAPPLALR